MAAGSNLGQVQIFNRRLILEIIRTHGPISRAEVARRTNLTRQTISNIVNDLLESDLVLITGLQKTGGGGKPSSSLEINPTAAYSVGINLYLDEMTGVLVDLGGRIHQRIHRHLDFPTPNKAAPLVEEVVKSLLEAEGIGASKLWGVGIGLPGPIGIVTHSSPNRLSIWRETAVAEEFKDILGVPVFVENNANAGTIGERWYGAGREFKNFVYLSFGLYLGGGIIINGQLYGGSGGFSGEFGDLPVRVAPGSDGIRSLGEVASPAALLERLAAAGRSNVSIEELAPLFLAGDGTVTDWLDEIAEHVGTVLATVEYILDPEAVVVGGRLPVPLLEYLVERLDQTIPPLRTRNKPYQPKLIVSDAGGDAAALGAATLPLYQTLSPHPSVLLISPSASASRTLRHATSSSPSDGDSLPASDLVSALRGRSPD
jgi:predicted NBD/HSP70 family sugar kinase